MDRPSISKALRRSTARLLSPTSPQAADLQSCVYDFSAVSKVTRALAQTEQSAAQGLLDWTQKDDNAAVKDVAFQTNELFLIWTEKQINFAGELERSVEQLRKIGELEKSVQSVQKQIAQLAEKEGKVRKDIKKAQKWKKGGDVRLIEHRLDEIRRSKEAAERQLVEAKNEAQVVKMFRFRQAMQGMADAYRNLGATCTSIFECQREISELVPAVSTQNVSQMTYDGRRITRERVRTLRNRLGVESTNDASTPRRADAPPPYSTVASDGQVCQNCRNGLYPAIPNSRCTP